jgi:hypothetical protein
MWDFFSGGIKTSDKSVSAIHKCASFFLCSIGDKHFKSLERIAKLALNIRALFTFRGASGGYHDELTRPEVALSLDILVCSAQNSLCTASYDRTAYLLAYGYSNAIKVLFFGVCQHYLFCTEIAQNIHRNKLSHEFFSSHVRFVIQMMFAYSQIFHCLLPFFKLVLMLRLERNFLKKVSLKLSSKTFKQNVVG